jgi:hypothetical protein
MGAASWSFASWATTTTALAGGLKLFFRTCLTGASAALFERELRSHGTCVCRTSGGGSFSLQPCSRACKFFGVAVGRAVSRICRILLASSRFHSRGVLGQTLIVIAILGELGVGFVLPHAVAISMQALVGVAGLMLIFYSIESIRTTLEEQRINLESRTSAFAERRKKEGELREISEPELVKLLSKYSVLPKWRLL